ncbi:MAG TPA: hypothetical protein VNA31_10500 [bacterium]|nr:hypothetical protein [bacterium]
MRNVRVIAAMTLFVLAITSGGLAAPAKQRTVTYEPGQQFCPSQVLLAGKVVVQPGRCYALFVLRDNRGTFLAFASPEAKIPPGQLVRLTTPAGAKLRGHIFYLVPIVSTVAIVPIGTVTSITVRSEDEGPRLSLTIIGTPSPNLTVIFTVRQ